ncbi:MAG: hypothetical protein DI539_06045 [Flavobacterium psychrophilum]|nr:MAG: hypothetical protein DI539_06045 [Flavobacterium psychrophilum]
MRNYFSLLLLAISFAGFSQASATHYFDITVNIPFKPLKDVDFYLLTYSSGVHPQECNYTIQPLADSKTKVHLVGNYSYIIGPKGFLGTICIAVRSQTHAGTEEIQNYFIDIEKETNVNDEFTLEIGDIKLDTIAPYITASYVDNRVLIKYDSSAKNQADTLLSRLTKWTKFRKINK